MILKLSKLSNLQQDLVLNIFNWIDFERIRGVKCDVKGNVYIYRLYTLRNCFWHRSVSVYHYCTTSWKEAWTKVLLRLKSCSWRVGDLRWWGSLTMIPVGNETTRLLPVNHTIKIIYQNLILKLAQVFCQSQWFG